MRSSGGRLLAGAQSTQTAPCLFRTRSTDVARACAPSAVTLSRVRACVILLYCVCLRCAFYGVCVRACVACAGPEHHRAHVRLVLADDAVQHVQDVRVARGVHRVGRLPRRRLAGVLPDLCRPAAAAAHAPRGEAARACPSSHACLVVRAWDGPPMSCIRCAPACMRV